MTFLTLLLFDGIFLLVVLIVIVDSFYYSKNDVNIYISVQFRLDHNACTFTTLIDFQ